MKKVLLVDDDKENLTLIARMLQPHYQTILASSGKEGLQMAIRDQPDLVLLDVNMPEMDGFEVCTRLREQPGTRTIPVIMLTTVTGLDSRVKGLDLGADDYIGKPFQARELVARINARLRRNEMDRRAENTIEAGNLKLDPRAFQVWIDSKEVHLTRIEFEILRYFLEHPNQVIERSKLLGDLWPDAVVTNRTVDTHVANLRKKIKGFSVPLDTIYGAGYILKMAGL
ncbi:MAG TPA: response regulator transcription factor [Bdellovibrionota bacterium]|nr:response regulator transcription factor [Bdellovibrionota bacterium]